METETKKTPKNVCLHLTEPTLYDKSIVPIELYKSIELWRLMMRNDIGLYEADLANQKNRLSRLLIKKETLDGEIAEAEENVRVLERLLTPKLKIAEVENELTGSMVGKTGKRAYIDAVNHHFKDNPFNATEIREYTHAEGLRIKGEKLKESTSRGIIKELLKDKVIEKVKRGLYRKKREETKPIPMFGQIANQ